MVLGKNGLNTKKWSLAGACFIASLFISTTVYAAHGVKKETPLTNAEVQKLINQSHFDKSFQISATPEVVSELNHIRSNQHAVSAVTESLVRMKKYQGYIQTQLTKNNMPHELLAIPLVESGYQPLPPNVNPVKAAGIWQIIPGTAEKYGLVINDKRDDRMNTELSTQGALQYLSALHGQFNNWGLTVVSYEIGENQTQKLVQNTGSKDVWVIAGSPKAPKSLKEFVAGFDAALIIIKNPQVLK